jgi:5'-deoxynucleotidase YfbR-like protein
MTEPMHGDFVADDRGPIVTAYPSGVQIHPYDASPDEIHIADIAHHLSLICRFGGGCREFYPVGQHSVLVMRLCLRLLRVECRNDIDPNEVLPLALMHDADEYVFGDMTAPVKSRLHDYKAAAQMFQERIFRKLRIIPNPKYWTLVKKADRFMRRVEADFLGKARIEHDERDAPPIPDEARRLVASAWSPRRAEEVFLAEASRWWDLETGEKQQNPSSFEPPA